MADTPTQNSSPKPLGRSVLILHAIGLAFLLASVGVFVVLGAEQKEGYTFLGFGGAGFAVLSLWSLVLAVRSYLANEHSRLAYAVTLLMLLECTAGPLVTSHLVLNPSGLDGWIQDYINPLIQDCLPALTAFLFIVIGGGLPLSRFLARKVDEAQRERRCRRNFLWIALASVLVVFPLLLGLYSLLTLGSGYGPPPINSRVARLVPVFICDWVEAAVDSKTGGNQIQNALLFNGCVSEQRLIERLSDNVADHFENATEGLATRYPKRVLPVCLQLIKSKAQIGWMQWAFVIGDQASFEQIQQIIADQSYSPRIRGLLLSRVGERFPNADFVAERIELAAEEPQYRRQAASFDLQSPQVAARFRAEWKKRFSQKDWPPRAGLAYLIPFLECPLTKQLTLFQECWTDSDPQLRRAALSSACRGSLQFNWKAADPDEAKPWLRALLPLLDDPDIFIRRSAVQLIAIFTGATISVTPDECALTEQPGWTPSPPVPGEDQEREAIRAAAKKWLAQQL